MIRGTTINRFPVRVMVTQMSLIRDLVRVVGDTLGAEEDMVVDTLEAEEQVMVMADKVTKEILTGGTMTEEGSMTEGLIRDTMIRVGMGGVVMVVEHLVGMTNVGGTTAVTTTAMVVATIVVTALATALTTTIAMLVVMLAVTSNLSGRTKVTDSSVKNQIKKFRNKPTGIPQSRDLESKN